MTNHIDIASRIILTVLNTGISPESAGRNLGEWIQEQDLDAGEGDVITDAITLVASRINPTLVEWFDDLLFHASCECPGDLGRRIDAARMAVIPGLRNADPSW